MLRFFMRPISTQTLRNNGGGVPLRSHSSRRSRANYKHSTLNAQ